jgi:hypothetical protein
VNTLLQRFVLNAYHCLVTALLVFAGLSLPIGSARADDVRIEKLTMGFQGLGRVGSWLPLELHASGLDAGQKVSLHVTGTDPRGDLCESIVAEASVAPDGKISLRGVLMTGRQDVPLQLSLMSDTTELWRQTVNCIGQRTEATTEEKPDDILRNPLVLLRHQSIGVLVAGTPAGLGELSDRLIAAENESMTLFTLPALADFPSERRAFDAIDTVVIASEYSLSDVQTQALRDWVQTGGNLIVSCGDQLPELLDSPLGHWLQPEFGIQSEPLRTQELGAIQNFVSGASLLQTNRQNVAIVRMTSDQPRILVNSINGPLISRISAGAGVVTMVAVDLNQRPLNRWLSLPQLYEMLLFDRLLDLSDEKTRQRGRISSSGVSDLSTQLAAVSDAIPPENRWSSWHAMLLMLVYLAIIGPLDYLLVVKLLARPKLTWLTFPLLVAAGCGFAFWSSNAQSSPVTTRAVHLLDVTQKDKRQTVRQRSWSSLSTSDSRFSSVQSVTSEDLAALTSVSRHEVLNWHGRAEDVYGGLYRERGAGLGRQKLLRTDIGTSRFDSIPLIVDGSQAFLSESYAETDSRPVFTSQLTMAASGLLEGSFQHHLPFTIYDWAIVFGNRVYLPAQKADNIDREIPANTSWERHSGNVRVTEIRDFLRGIRVIERTQKQQKERTGAAAVQTPYNPAGRNPLDILLMISLHNTAGGDVYTRLQNQYLRRDEVSDACALNTAMLIGTIDPPLSRLQLDSETIEPVESRTIVRLFLPVQRRINDSGYRDADPDAK